MPKLLHICNGTIGHLQPIHRDLKDNGVVAMSVVLTKGANENPFVYDNHHGSDDVMCKPRMTTKNNLFW